MKLSKNITFFIAQFFFAVACFAQNEKIDSLKKALPALKDSARVDCLNALCEANMQQSGNGFNLWNLTIVQADSATLYAQQALEQADLVNYIKGKAKACYNLGRIEGVLVRDFRAMENYFRKGLEFSKQIHDDELLASTYGCLGMSLYYQSKFTEAIESFEKAGQLFQKMGDKNKLAETYFLMSATEWERGFYEKSLQYAVKSKEVAGKEDFDNLGHLYKALGDYEAALNLIGKDQQWALCMGEIFVLKKQYDSAKYYYRIFENYVNTKNETYRIQLYSHLGELYLSLRVYDTALVYLNKALKWHRKINDRNGVMWVLLRLGKTYNGQGNNEKALEISRMLLNMAEETGARQYFPELHLLLYNIFESLYNKDSAYFHLRQYTITKDVMDKDLSAHKLAFYKAESERKQAQSRIDLLNKEKQLQQEELKQTSQQRKFLLVGVVGFILIGIVLFRNILLKRKNEKHLREIAENELEIQKLESEKQLTELEMQALRAQMNPHFIFNSLNSINRFILQNNKAQASEYLTKFSKLVRLILQNSQARLISLDSELESLKLYLELESVRFDHHFKFNIKVDDDLDTDIIKVPPLIIQPYTENAIWHGLMHKEEKGKLEIELFQEDDMLCCKITDDGIGRKKAAELKSKSASTHKSMGMQITASRIEMLQQKKQLDAHIKITDLVLADGSTGGTEVLLKIPLMQ